mgnify:CR=1 FL=1
MCRNADERRGADEQGQGDGQEKGGAGRVRGAEKIPVFNHAHQHPLVVFKGGVVVIKLHLLNTGIGGIGKIAVIHQGEAVLPDRLAGGEGGGDDGGGGPYDVGGSSVG